MQMKYRSMAVENYILRQTKCVKIHEEIIFNNYVNLLFLIIGTLNNSL